MSIRKRKSKKLENGYSYQVYFSYVDKYTNERKTHSKSGFIHYEDAVIYEEKKKNELRQQNRFRVTIDIIFQEWLEIEAVYKYQENTIIDYKNRYYKHIYPRLGNVYIQDVDYKLLQRFFNENINIGNSTNYKLKEILNVIINFSIKCGYIHVNPMKYVYVVRKENDIVKDKVYTDHDFDQIIDILIDSHTHKRYAYALALFIGKYTGLRISEVFALEKADFDFNDKLIFINKKLVYSNKTRQEIYSSKTMKTKSSNSILPLHEDLEMIIIKWFNYHQYNQLFTDTKGIYLNPKQLEYTLWRISKDLNISFNFHMLRHTLATKLVKNGANIKVTQELLRHANISTTMNIYAHINENQKKQAIYTAFPKTNK